MHEERLTAEYLKLFDGVARIAFRVVAHPHYEVDLNDEQPEAGIAAVPLIGDCHADDCCYELQESQAVRLLASEPL